MVHELDLQRLAKTPTESPIAFQGGGRLGVRGGREASEAKTERKGETERGRQTRRQEERQTVVPPVVEGDAGSVCAFVCAWG